MHRDKNVMCSSPLEVLHGKEVTKGGIYIIHWIKS